MLNVEDPAPRIAPPITEATRPFWTGGLNGSLMIQYCPSCSCWIHPLAEACPECGGALQSRAASGTASVFSFTVNRYPYHPEVSPPYVIALVELEEQPGLRLVTNIVNCDPASVSIGQRVQVLFEHAGEAWIPVFEPVAR